MLCCRKILYVLTPTGRLTLLHRFLSVFVSHFIFVYVFFSQRFSHSCCVLAIFFSQFDLKNILYKICLCVCMILIDRGLFCECIHCSPARFSKYALIRILQMLCNTAVATMTFSTESNFLNRIPIQRHGKRFFHCPITRSTTFLLLI